MIDILIAFLILLGNDDLCAWGHEATAIPDEDNIVAYAGVVDSFDLFLVNDADINSIILFGYNEDRERGLVCAREREIENATNQTR